MKGYFRVMTEYQEILDFWFNDINDHPEKLPQHSTLWWAKKSEIDHYIIEHFSDYYQQAIQNQCQHWLTSAKGRLALIILLDQFSRNMYRNDARAYAQDSQALAIATDSINQEQDKQLQPLERAFLYMPLEHAEDLVLQNRCVTLFEKLSNDAPSNIKNYLTNMLDFAKKHRDVIQQFGRFPHRNKMLKRQSSAEEELFLLQPGSSF